MCAEFRFTILSPAANWTESENIKKAQLPRQQESGINKINILQCLWADLNLFLNPSRLA